MSFMNDHDSRFDTAHFKPPFTESLERIAITISALQAKYRILERLNKEAVEAAKQGLSFPKK